LTFKVERLIYKPCEISTLAKAEKIIYNSYEFIEYSQRYVDLNTLNFANYQ